MVHPIKDELNLFIDNKLADQNKVRSIKTHIAECEFCREYCDLYRRVQTMQLETDAAEFSDSDREVAERVYRESLTGKVIPLNVMTGAQPLDQTHLAADGESETTRPATNLITLYSEEPEMVLRVMRDFKQGIDYLQLIGTDPNLTAHVLIRVQETGKEYLTDAVGRAVIPRGELGDAEPLHWEVKLPDVSFNLRPVSYDPERIESSREVTLETDQHDKILVTFASKVEGKQISIRVLELDGQTDFDGVRVSIGQPESHEIKRVAPNQTVSFGSIDPDQEINIRLYR